MPVSSGREFLSIPGPTVIPDAVLAAMQRPAVDIYSGPLVALTDTLLADMSRIFATAGAPTSTRRTGMAPGRPALTNVLSRGDKVLVLESGRFAIAWGEAAKMLGARSRCSPGDIRRAVQPEAGRGEAQGRTAASRRSW
jgi:alanine-glyoxylate transaminase/serine-glyoxylate transaminase/serine-pyruvate transaminase